MMLLMPLMGMSLLHIVYDIGVRNLTYIVINSPRWPGAIAHVVGRHLSLSCPPLVSVQRGVGGRPYPNMGGHGGIISPPS